VCWFIESLLTSERRRASGIASELGSYEIFLDTIGAGLKM
jgi:hypothetical protein